MSCRAEFVADAGYKTAGIGRHHDAYVDRIIAQKQGSRFTGGPVSAHKPYCPPISRAKRFLQKCDAFSHPAFIKDAFNK